MLYVPYGFEEVNDEAMIMIKKKHHLSHNNQYIHSLLMKIL